MYIYSNLTGKIYLNDVEIIADDTKIPWQEYDKWKSTGGVCEVVEFTENEIAELNKPKVPEAISRMNLKIQLLLKGIEIAEIVEEINTIPDSLFTEVAKKIALIKFNEAVIFDRYNADLNLVATLMGLSQQDLDEIFINGNIL
jgi:hypothetical protein